VVPLQGPLRVPHDPERLPQLGASERTERPRIDEVVGDLPLSDTRGMAFETDPPQEPERLGHSHARLWSAPGFGSTRYESAGSG
jgi:hypothetical protein